MTQFKKIVALTVLISMILVPVALAATPPVASFTYQVNDYTAYGYKVQFTDTSTGSPTYWFWNFGDGGTSTTGNPTYYYTDSGTYTVRLTVMNAAGNSTATQIIKLGSGKLPKPYPGNGIRVGPGPTGWY